MGWGYILVRDSAALSVWLVECGRKRGRVWRWNSILGASEDVVYWNEEGCRSY